MPRPSQRSGSLRKIRKRTPGGRLVIHYERRKPGVARCTLCGRPLNGVPRLRSVKLRRLSKTSKTVSRPYGGVICTECLANLIKRSVMVEEGSP
ncbi:MAG: 50S ribosomal protein L34e [Desulfurococcales archaeon]|nr:50S ribosomal protein L34e [Desulfurococcales archaeon]